MTLETLAEKKTLPMAGMSQIVYIAKPERACCVVGSCIALALYHPRTGQSGLAHIVLPRSTDRTGPPGKFADTAARDMVKTLCARGAKVTNLVAKISGGASMFGKGGPIQIGKQNIEAVIQELKQMEIPILGEHLGGSKGRRITFDSCTGEMLVEIVGQPSKTI